MTVVTLEILKPEDVDLVVQLAKRLHVEKIDVSEDWGKIDFPVGGLPMTEDELDAHLEKTLEEPGMSFEEFKNKIGQWK